MAKSKGKIGGGKEKPNGKKKAGIIKAIKMELKGGAAAAGHARGMNKEHIEEGAEWEWSNEATCAADGKFHLYLSTARRRRAMYPRMSCCPLSGQFSAMRSMGLSSVHHFCSIYTDYPTPFPRVQKLQRLPSQSYRPPLALHPLLSSPSSSPICP